MVIYCQLSKYQISGSFFVSRGNHQIQFFYEIQSEPRRESFLESIGEIPDMQKLVENLSVTKNQTYRCPSNYELSLTFLSRFV